MVSVIAVAWEKMKAQLRASAAVRRATFVASGEMWDFWCLNN
ncbi:hypothetical protein P262_00918 [Cronobacter malonaticus]|uniref:Uncharacterized protein n=1 Tax=Cronobacter malonaticus TaxID=413503 RepID=V5TUR4_9ENTR|nr:hypothetical protein P262_00918 [Cronobacter malonaticus]